MQRATMTPMTADPETILSRLVCRDQHTERRLRAAMPRGLTPEQLLELAATLGTRRSLADRINARSALERWLAGRPERPFDELRRPSLAQLSAQLPGRRLVRA